MAREISKKLLDKIVRMREQLSRLHSVLMMRLEERAASGMEREECQRLWNAYQRATTQSVQLDAEVRSMTEDQGSRSSGKRQLRPTLPSSYEWTLAKGWKNIRRQPGIGESSE